MSSFHYTDFQNLMRNAVAETALCNLMTKYSQLADPQEDLGATEVYNGATSAAEYYPFCIIIILPQGMGMKPGKKKSL